MIKAGDIDIALGGLSEAAAAAILSARAAAAGGAAGVVEQGRPLLLCEIGGERFGFDLADVAQTIAAQRPTRVPGAPAVLLGVVMRRGRLYNVFDPGPALGVSAQVDADGHLLLLRSRAPRLALRVDRTARLTRLAAGVAIDPDRMTMQTTAEDGTALTYVAVPMLIEALGLAGHR